MISMFKKWRAKKLFILQIKVLILSFQIGYIDIELLKREFLNQYTIYKKRIK